MKTLPLTALFRRLLTALLSALSPVLAAQTAGGTARILCASTLLALLPAATAASELVELPGCTLVPTDWADGDSFLVRAPGKGEITIRLYGADCIERSANDSTDARRLRAQRRYFGITQAKSSAAASIELAKSHGNQAAAETRRLLREPFTVHTAFADARGDGRYQRFYGFVTTADGTDLAEHLVAHGYARAYGVYRQTHDGRSHEEYRESLRDLELTAARNGRGVWAATNWDTLTRERKEQRDEEAELEAALDKSNAGPDEKIDPNTAARDDLMRLPGIGETYANRIIEGRPYSAAEDLLRVSGIGPSRLQQLRPHLLFANSNEQQPDAPNTPTP